MFTAYHVIVAFKAAVILEIERSWFLVGIESEVSETEEMRDMSTTVKSIVNVEQKRLALLFSAH